MSLCVHCKQTGRLGAGTHLLPSGSWCCDEHWRQQLGIPKSQSKGETAVAKKPDETTIAAIRADAAAGMSTEQIRVKRHVSWPTAKKYAGNGLKHAKKNTSTRSAAANGEITLKATPALLDGIWNSLSLEKKADLLTKLA